MHLAAQDACLSPVAFLSTKHIISTISPVTVLVASASLPCSSARAIGENARAVMKLAATATFKTVGLFVELNMGGISAGSRRGQYQVGTHLRGVRLTVLRIRRTSRRDITAFVSRSNRQTAKRNRTHRADQAPLRDDIAH